MQHGYLDKYSSLNSIIHSVDARVKILSLFGFLFCVLFTKPTAYLSFFLYFLIIEILIVLSKIPVGFIIKRAFVIIPFIIMAAVFIPFFKGGEAFRGYSFAGVDVNISYDGLLILWNIIIKSSLSILASILLISTTPLPKILKSLEALKVNKIFILILSFMYRYIFIVQDEFMRVKQAKESRSIGKRKWADFRILANIVGVLFVRSYERSERVYMAMLSRGFDGKIKSLKNKKIGFLDICFAVSFFAALIVARYFYRGLG